MSNAIIFPNLGITLSNVPEFLTIGSISISLYGLIIGTAMIVAFLWCYSECRYYNVDRDHFIDLTIIIIIAGIIGARLYYVIFAFDYYKNNPISILKVWEGGLGIYGGIILGLIAVIVCCKIFKLDFWLVADIVSLGVILGQIAGRWGNFFNREAFGDYTNSLFAMMIPYDRIRSADFITDNMLDNLIVQNGEVFVSVHPTFLYESLWNLCVLIFLILFRKHKKFDGQIFLLYIGLYGVGRFMIESLRTDQLQIGDTGIAISQVVAIIMIIVSVVLQVVFIIKKKGATPRIKPQKEEKSPSNSTKN
ncbi:MAG: prolipoprotein diacylglyceryl transferase [Lachnospiraceae bacterium]|nr:prolipoprotein diacylglyceryl transferase [Lachnospiraceae bacterium]